MGYQVDFKVSLPIRDEFKSMWSKDLKQSEVNKYMHSLISTCVNMGKFVPEKREDIKLMNMYLNTIYETLEYNVNFYARLVIEKWKKDIEERIKENNGDIWFCGWEYARDDYDTEETVEEKMEYVVESIYTIISTVKTPDYYENSENFFEYRKEITEYVDFIEEEVNRWMTHKFIKVYDDCKVRYDDEEEEVNNYHNPNTEADINNKPIDDEEEEDEVENSVL